MGIKEALAQKALEAAAKAHGMTVEELLSHRGLISEEGFPCPTCRQAKPMRHTQMIIPNGSSTPRCPICEPELLWDEAYTQWKLANPTSPW